MTIALCIKVNEGIVFAADSAVSLVKYDNLTGKKSVVQVYNTAKKIFNLCNNLPIGAITWGAADIGSMPIYELIGIFRNLLNQDPYFKINPDDYTVKEFADKLNRFAFEKYYENEFKKYGGDRFLGFFIAGFSSKEDLPEAWRVFVKGEIFNAATVISAANEAGGGFYDGQVEAIRTIKETFEKSGICLSDDNTALSDIINLSNYLIETTINFEKQESSYHGH